MRIFLYFSCVYLCVAFVTLPLAGCGAASRVDQVPVVPVTGKVVFQGQPTPGALVVYHPAQEGALALPPAQATVRDDGTYTLTTYTANDGAAPGEYKVTVEWRKLVSEDGDVKPGPNLLPDRIGQVKSTDLVVRVAEGTDQVHALEIK